MTLSPPTRVDVCVRPNVPVLLTPDECRAVLATALDAAGAPAHASVTLTLSHDVELARLNAAHLGATGPTDVLSFPLLPPAAFPPHTGQDPAVRSTPRLPAFALPPDAMTHLGDIVISVERAVEQAEEGRGGHTGDVRWSPQDELRLLITHGALHLCGWDHAEPAEEAAMRALEQRLLGLSPSVA